MISREQIWLEVFKMVYTAYMNHDLKNNSNFGEHSVYASECATCAADMAITTRALNTSLTKLNGY